MFYCLDLGWFNIQLVYWNGPVKNRTNKMTVSLDHFHTIYFLCTVGIWNLDNSGFQMVEKRLGCKWSGLLMGSEIQKPNLLKTRLLFVSGFRLAGSWKSISIRRKTARTFIYKKYANRLTNMNQVFSVLFQHRWKRPHKGPLCPRSSPSWSCCCLPRYQSKRS